METASSRLNQRYNSSLAVGNSGRARARGSHSSTGTSPRGSRATGDYVHVSFICGANAGEGTVSSPAGLETMTQFWRTLEGGVCVLRPRHG
ncbi:hypothetical protein DAEQUDRAFT_727044 [Daedalea quercina L-15889]|uniref:Uncharacterized protein n=1 Tax=Daedalea quercina L-15889 TaxID=1314783 RepID=A0A165Q8P6_9APHY|nr:hypothetical protein DAEQUDRAFT_727044 [Daedalea quercina L-15889]